MATANKHRERSHYSYHAPKPFAQFEARAQVKRAKKEREGFFKKLFRRMTNK